MSLYFPLGWLDAFDVLAVAAVVFALLVWLRRSRARLALVGMAIAGAIYLLARLAGFALTAWVLQGFFAVLVIVLVVVFQEDLRRFFEGLAAWGLLRRPDAPSATVADVIVRSVARLAETRTGALIVIPGIEPLDRHLEGGIALDALLSEPLLLSLFDASSPGHDGAVLISKDRAVRFALHLPLSTNQAELGPGGTRHAAALGLAERTDCLCVVVSEERGTLSVARHGRLRRLAQPGALLTELQRIEQAVAPGSAASVSRVRRLASHWREGLVALAVALALWTVRVPGSTQAEVVRPAAVVIDKLPPEFEIESVDPPEVQVTLRGLRRDLLFQSGEPVEARIDALLVKLGRRTFRVGPEQIRTPVGLEALAVEPGQVRISLRSRGSEAAP